MHDQEQIDESVLQLQVVSPRGGYRERSGRPLFITARRFIKICRWIEKGESAVDACRHECCTYSGFRSHVSRNPKYAKRLKKAEAVREQWLREFHIDNIKQHAPRTVAASLFWLERRYPAEFSLRPVNRPDSASDEKRHYQALTQQEILECIRASERVELERPKGCQTVLPDTNNNTQ